ncbi:hypothetical protein NLG97_g9987 [Lecanicillium saksenae]|uniref:Uncharacterized protein n=1 Tax=Lecanicillium saksenae TaxID=468837 RepID=A0ACC1QGY1_9HYPO|nr:hypothetical protein NLG97_g9987 [Lecanicillium saksenae]
MHLSVALVAALAQLGSATVGLTWSFPAAERNLDQVSFPFDLSKAPHEEGFYFAQQFYFDGIPEGAYTGLQPRPDNADGPVLHAAFSSFIDGTTTGSSSCYYGADGGPGVSCAIDFKADYSHTFTCVVETTDGGSTWKGTVVDDVTGESHVIGEWTLPTKPNGIIPKSTGFVEYYIYPRGPDGKEICSALPLTEVTFLYPDSSTVGANYGYLEEPYEYGVCEGASAFSTKQEFLYGYYVKTGF